MQINRRFLVFEAMLLALVLALTGAFHQLKADTGTCGGTTTTLPFNDVGSSAFFCQIAAAYFSGLTNGTTATTYSPTATVTREQMAAFITRTQDGALRRGSPRAALGQWWTNQSDWNSSRLIDGVGGAFPYTLVQTDGHNVYVADSDSARIIRRSLVDGTVRLFTGLTNPFGVLYQNGWLWATGRASPGRLYRMALLDSTATQMSASLGDNPEQLAYDGGRIWTANKGNGSNGSVSIYDARGGALQNVTGFLPIWGIVYDGANMWVSEEGDPNSPFFPPSLLKLDANGNVIVRVLNVGPGRPVFDGTNIWVPGYNSNSVAVVRAATATLIATLTGNNLNLPTEAAFDGQRILVTNRLGSISLWKATDLTRIGNFTAQGLYPFAACSNGAEFFITAVNGYPNASAWYLLRY